jgi:hypothetical protein
LNEREKREKWGERERESRGIFPPLFIARGDGGMRRIGGGGGAWAWARRRERREVGDDGWAPPVSEGGGRARPSAARAWGEADWAAGRGERERGGGEMGRAGPREGRGTFRVFLFVKLFQLCLFLNNYYLCYENSTKIYLHILGF